MCKHPSYAWVKRGSSAGPDEADEFYLYDCLLCDTRFRWYPKSNKIEELPKGIVGLIPANLN